VLEDLKSFEKSLSEWLSSLDNMDKRISDIEQNFQVQEKEQSGLNQSIAGIESMLSDLNAKVGKIEKMKDVSGVRNILKSYEGTLNVFKKRFSGMAKKVEDLEVKTAVLEKIYKTSQEPLENLMQAIDEQNVLITSLAGRLDADEKSFVAMIEDLKKQAMPSESFNKRIEELNDRIADLESGTLVVKTDEKKDLHGAPKEVHDKHDHDKVDHGKADHGKVAEVHHEETIIPTEVISEMEGFIDIGKGFYIKNVEFKPFGSSTTIKGKITNKTEWDYSISDFKVQAYNEEGVPLGGHGFSIMGFKSNTTEEFEEIIVGVEPEKITKYAIFSEEVLSLSATGEEEIRIIERVPEAALAEAKEIHHETEGGEAAKELEGFEDIGGGFYVRNVFFARFGSSSTVTGEILNNSEKDYYSASFVMKVYSKNYGMITSFDFPVRQLKSGETKPFEEIVAGVRPVDIFRYEILFKKSY